MVRDAATDALGVLLVCRRECFKDVFAHGDEMIKTLRGHYKPGQTAAIPLAPLEPQPQPEKLPSKSEEVKGEVGSPLSYLKLR